MYIYESKTILTPQNGLNVYRGRTESTITLRDVTGPDALDIGVKTDAAELLNGVLKKRRGQGLILMGNLGDPYNGLEEEYRIVRHCLQVIENMDYGVVISTRSSLIMRDMDILRNINHKTRVIVEIPFPTAKKKVFDKLEGIGERSDIYRTTGLAERIKLIEGLISEGIDVIVDITPLIPFINDSEDDVYKTLEVLKDAGVTMIDPGDLKLIIKKSGYDYFTGEFRARFPKEFEAFSKDYDGATELIPQNQDVLRKMLTSYCNECGIECDKNKIKGIRRQYVNKTMGEQMSLF